MVLSKQKGRGQLKIQKVNLVLCWVFAAFLQVVLLKGRPDRLFGQNSLVPRLILEYLSSTNILVPVLLFSVGWSTVDRESLHHFLQGFYQYTVPGLLAI